MPTHPSFRFVIRAVMIAFCTVAFAKGQTPWRSDSLIPVWRDGLWGYVDQDGELRIKPQFSSTTFFDFAGTAIVTLPDSGDHEFLLKYNGEIIVPSVPVRVIQRRTPDFLSAVIAEDIESDITIFLPIVLMDNQGRIITPLKKGEYWEYTCFPHFEEMPPLYLEDDPYRSAGLFIVGQADASSAFPYGRSGVMDASGKFVVPYTTKSVFISLDSTLIVFRSVKTEKYGLMNFRQEVLIKPMYANITEGISQGFDRHKPILAQGEDGKYGYINIKGDTLIDFIYEEGHDFVGDSALVVFNDSALGRRVLQVLDLKGGVLRHAEVPLVGQNAHKLQPFDAGGEKTGFMDDQGKIVIKPAVERETYHVFTMKDGRQYYLFIVRQWVRYHCCYANVLYREDGKMLLPNIEGQISPCFETYFKFENGAGQNLYRLDGSVVLSEDVEWIHEINENRAIVEKELEDKNCLTHWSLVDLEGWFLLDWREGSVREVIEQKKGLWYFLVISRSPGGRYMWVRSDGKEYR